MKKRNLFLLSIAAFMALCACGGRSQSKSSSEESKQPESSSEPAPVQSSSSEPAPVQSSSESAPESSTESEESSSEQAPESSEPEEQGYVDPEVELDDLEEPTIDLEFADVEDTCMINPKAKTYIDAMEEQEKTLDRPYHFSSLYGPDDYAYIAAQSDKGDGTTYAAKDTGGIDVCQILNRNDYSNDCKNYPIRVEWESGYMDDEHAVVKFWSTEDQSDVREVPVKIDANDEDIAYAELPNLYRARKYRMQVVDDNDISNSFEFTTGDYPRTITMGGVHNVRDIGGYVTSYGVRTNQGLMYRGYYIDDKNGGHGVNYSAEVQKVQEEVMQIGYEIDLQKSSETNGRTASALNSEATPCDYICRTLVSYENFLKKDSYQNLPEVMHIMAHSDEKHTYFHCWGGADRTGMLAFFINAICGVSYTDLMEDFELTTQTNNKRCHMHNSSSAHYPKFMNAFINGYTDSGVTWDGFDPDKTINENCEKWLIEIAEVDPDDIERIREIMLPGYADGELEADKLIPSYEDEETGEVIQGYAASGEWVSDELAHWKVADEDENIKCQWHRHDGTECSVCGYGKQGGGQGGQGGEQEVDYNRPIGRVWTEGTPANNSVGKQYIPLSETSTGKVGVKILVDDYSPSPESTASMGSDRKIAPQNDETVYLSYRIKAPKAGTYQLVMNGRVSQSGLGMKLSERAFKVTLNGASVAIEDTITDILTADGDNDFVAAPAIQLTGNEDVVTIACPNYRIAFTANSYLTFIEH